MKKSIVYLGLALVTFTAPVFAANTVETSTQRVLSNYGKNHTIMYCNSKRGIRPR